MARQIESPPEFIQRVRGALLALVCAAELLSGCKTSPQNAAAQGKTIVPLAPATTTNAGPRLPTLFIVGDSTVHLTGRGWSGWGDVIAGQFDPQQITVENRARGGRTSRTFHTEGLWDKLLADSKPGDFVIIQLGHNDGGPLDDNARARGSIPGIGEESKEIYNPVLKKQEVVHTYGWYMRKFITDSRDKGITPIICSPVPHVPKQKVKPDTVEPNRYATWAAEIATSHGSLFIDLNQIIMSRYTGLTPQEVKMKYFTSKDNTHANPVGAELNASCVVEGIRGLTNCSLKNFLLSAPPAVNDPK